MKRWHVAILAIAVLVTIVAASLSGDSTPTVAVYTEPATVRLVVSSVSAQGQIDPKLKVNIGAHIIGKVVKLYVREGDAIRKGQKLVELEKQGSIEQRKRMAAEVASRRIEAQRAEAGLTLARLSYERAVSLQKQGIQAPESLDRARAELANASAAVGTAEASVRQARAGLAQSDDELSRTTIVSPVDGTIVELNAHEGEVVVTGTMNNPASVIAVVADLSELVVETEVGESDIVVVRTGQTAKVRVDALAGEELESRVTEIGSSAVRSGTGAGMRYFNVQAAIVRPDARLRPGMTAQVSIVTDVSKTSVAVPLQSVVDRAPPGSEEREGGRKKNYVFVVRDGKVRQTEVKTGISDATHVAIASGLAPGDVIVTGPFRTVRNLRDGERIKIVPPSKDDGGKENG